MTVPRDCHPRVSPGTVTHECPRGQSRVSVPGDCHEWLSPRLALDGFKAVAAGRDDGFDELTVGVLVAAIDEFA